ncbi:GIY-YIG nuclease family protein [Agromyces sp. CFH 90414]|uniref:GIY-YIG nuclease family protein n=1 Tax=Agromyces agglutinans TaxID=2662258 RepID=A0A6I2FER2_9MICO|nr:GIY-YIG nuclease family protein [Agromyces agglutinans]MRG59548.1 GIY-YIG nuclease family protein [Agromyces agglutinans]
MTTACGIRSRDGATCAEPIEPGAPLPLCTTHLLLAHDWVERTTGAVDLLPAPCAACGHPVGRRYPAGLVCERCDWRVGDVPDDGVTDASVDVVYYVRWRDRVKIGTSASPRRRLAVLPVEEVLAFEPGDRLLERRRHEQFAAHRFAGTEWFALHADIRAHVADLTIGVGDPWVLVDRWTSHRLAARA